MSATDDDMTDDEAAEAYMAALADLERDPLRERIAELEAALRECRFLAAAPGSMDRDQIRAEVMKLTRCVEPEGGK